MNVEVMVDELVAWLQDHVRKAGSKGIVFGLSGGIDSAVIAGLGIRAFGKDALGIIMPIHSNPEDATHGKLVANTLGLSVKTVDLTQTFDQFLNDAGDLRHPASLSNVKPRLRMMTLYYYGQANNYLVCGSSNLSEFHIGYFTKCGDSGADLLPIANFLKSEIYELAEYLQIPTEIIQKKPSAGLKEGQTDEDDFGFTYEELNKTIAFDFTGVNRDKIDRMHRNTEHKRNFPPIFPYSR